MSKETSGSIEKPYYLEPEKGSAKAYALLRDALKQSKKVAVGNFVFMHHEHLGVIKPHGDLLVLNQLRYDNELINPKGLDIPGKVTLAKNELKIALQLIDQLTKPFHPKDYKDTYAQEIKNLIQKKAKGHKTVHKKEEKTQKAPKVQDIMSLLKASLERHQKQPKKTKRRKAA